MSTLAGRHAAVTGGGTGIGAAIARALAAEGVRLTLVGRRRELLEATAAELPGAFVSTADVTERVQVEGAFAAAREAHGPISILIANAGAATAMPFAKLTSSLWRETLAVNLDGVFHCCQTALPDLLDAGAGRIVTVASVAGLMGAPYIAHYVAAKHGAVGLTRALAAEFAGRGLTANAVCPGYVDTPLTDHSVANITAKTGRGADEARAGLAAMNPSGRLIAPQEVAALVVELLLSERSGEAVTIA